MILAMDVSRSMKAEDVEPTRLDAARAAAEAFRPGTRRSSAWASSRSRAGQRLGTTHARPCAHEERAGFALAGEGTAIGDAVALSIQLGEQKHAEGDVVPPRAILLISDGARDGGRIDPTQAAAPAKERGIPVHTVLVGTPDGVVRG